MQNDPDATDWVENRTFAEIAAGDSASHSRTVTANDLERLARLCGQRFANQSDDREQVQAASEAAPAMWGGLLIAEVLGTLLPGAGSTVLAQSLRFHGPVGVGDTITVTVKVARKHVDRGIVEIDCVCRNQRGEDVVTGEAQVLAPLQKVRRQRIDLPDVQLASHAFHDRVMAAARSIDPVPTAVVHPVSAAAINAAVEAARAGIIVPLLVGPEARIREAAEDAGVDISGFRIEHCLHSHAAAERSVELVRDGAARLIMKGALHTDELLGAVIDRARGLRTERRLSHAFLMSFPGRASPLIITDAAINVEPDLAAKADIARNAIDLARVVGISCPKVAILAAVETVNPAMRATLDAAALCKMADRGQITGGLIDGPLAYDNAVSELAARQKGITSAVAGRADILLVPNIESGNMLAKQLSFTGGADAAGVVLGARVPIILTSRADTLRTRLASCAVAAMMCAADTLAAPGLP